MECPVPLLDLKIHERVFAQSVAYLLIEASCSPNIEDHISRFERRWNCIPFALQFEKRGLLIEHVNPFIQL